MTQTLHELAAGHNVRFGTSGVRGRVADLSDAVCYGYTQAFLRAVARDARTVVVGHDLRPSSPAMVAACVQAISDAGAEAVFVGALPTPALALYCAQQRVPGICVTGSHIPFDRNGIKFYRADGEISKADEQAMERCAIALPALLAPAALPAPDPAALDAYLLRYVRFFGAGALAGKRVALYEHSSVARDVLRTMLEQLGAEVLSLGRTDSFVPIDTEAVRPEDIAQARAWAGEHRFDAILSTDGDADRPLLGDESGAWMRGDVVGILCAQFLGAEVVVTPVSSNTAVEQCGAFRQVIRTQIGSPHVIAAMQDAQRADPAAKVVGYEANGGFLLGSDLVRGTATLSALPTRDSALPMLALLVLSAQRGCALSQLARTLPARFTASDRLQHIPTEASRALLATLSQHPEQAAQLMAPEAGAVLRQDGTDGLRLGFASGDIVHLRPSGNAPELRCYTESDNEAAAQALCAACLARVATLITER